MNPLWDDGSTLRWHIISNLYAQMYTYFRLDRYDWPPGKDQLSPEVQVLFKVTNWNTVESTRIAESIREDLRL